MKAIIVATIFIFHLPFSAFADSTCVPLAKLGKFGAIQRNKSKPHEIQVAGFFWSRGGRPKGDHAILVADKGIDFPSVVEDYIVENRKEKRTVKFDDGSKASVPIYRLTKRCQKNEISTLDKEEADTMQQHLNALQRLQKKGTVNLKKKVEEK